MGEIKFRAWHKDNEVMGKITQMDLWSDEIDEHSFEIFADDEIIECEPDEIILLQYTGLKDKNGMEIYEGDIIRANKLTFESKLLPENLLVKFYGGMFQLYRGNENLMGLHLQYIEDGEIIGNIYENPELLKDNDSTAQAQAD
jgi:uncharacterized phage protein (TIGR01671 family)